MGIQNKGRVKENDKMQWYRLLGMENVMSHSVFSKKN